MTGCTCEELEDAGVRFDYSIRPGVSSAPNALHILARTGYPEAVMARAFEIYEAR